MSRPQTESLSRNLRRIPGRHQFGYSRYAGGRLADQLPGSGATHVAAVSGRGLFSPPPVTTMRPERIAADGAITFSGKLPMTRQVSALGSYSSKSSTLFRGG